MENTRSDQPAHSHNRHCHSIYSPARYALLDIRFPACTSSVSDVAGSIGTSIGTHHAAKFSHLMMDVQVPALIWMISSFATDVIITVTLVRYLVRCSDEPPSCAATDPSVCREKTKLV